MKRLTAIAFALLTACLSTRTSAPAPFESRLERDAILRVMTAAAEWQLANPSKHPSYDWTQAPFWIGLNAFAPLSNDPRRYFAAIRRHGVDTRWRPGLRPLCPDDHAITQSYFHVYEREPDPG